MCDAAGVDEDCNPATIGACDSDSDGYTDAACCNGARCGDDCDDDPIDAHVVWLARERRWPVLSSDRADLLALDPDLEVVAI